MNTSKNGVLSKMLDDLTHLEINTIIKKGMTSAPQPEGVEETLRVLLSNYRIKLNVLVKRNFIENTCSISQCTSFEAFYSALDEISNYMDSKKVRMEEPDYILFLRMKSFCNYLRSRTGDIVFKEKSRIPKEATIFSVNLDTFATFKLEINPRDRIMIKRIFDLGTEQIVMQTRIGIDGDVVTRIEENFAMHPKQMVIDCHDRHTSLSVKYWQSLIIIVKDFVSGIIG